ncbi:MAG: hypothetical protein ACI4SD_04315 [Suilimivivens sp.]
MPYRSFCIFILIASIALIGTAVGYQFLHLPNSTLLLKLGIISLLMGVYMYFDTNDISLRSDKMVFFLMKGGVNCGVRRYGVP